MKGDRLYDVNTASVCAQDSNANTYTKATCFVEGLGESSTVHYNYESTSDATCSSGLTPAAGDSATCTKSASDRIHFNFPVHTITLFD